MNKYKKIEKEVVNQLLKINKDILKVTKTDIFKKGEIVTFLKPFYDIDFVNSIVNILPLKKSGAISTFEGVIEYKVLDEIIKDFNKLSNKSDLIKKPFFALEMVIILFISLIIKEILSTFTDLDTPSFKGDFLIENILFDVNLLLTRKEKKKYILKTYNKALKNILKLKNGRLLLKGDKESINDHIIKNVIGFEMIYNYVTGTDFGFDQYKNFQNKRFFYINLYDDDEFFDDRGKYRDYAHVMRFCKNHFEKHEKLSTNTYKQIRKPKVFKEYFYEEYQEKYDGYFRYLKNEFTKFRGKDKAVLIYLLRNNNSLKQSKFRFNPFVKTISDEKSTSIEYIRKQFVTASEYKKLKPEYTPEKMKKAKNKLANFYYEIELKKELSKKQKEFRL